MVFQFKYFCTVIKARFVEVFNIIYLQILWLSFLMFNAEHFIHLHQKIRFVLFTDSFQILSVYVSLYVYYKQVLSRLSEQFGQTENI